MKNNNNIIVGLTGPWGSGCTGASKYLEEECNFKRISLSTKLEGIIKNIKTKKEIIKHLGEWILEKRGKGIIKKFQQFEKLKDLERRELLQDVGNALRIKKNSNSAIIDLSLNKIKQYYEDGKDVVIDSIKNIGETEKLLESFKNYFLININAEYEIRQKKKPEVTPNDFYQIDLRDAEEKIDSGQQVSKCTDLADIVILNNSDNVQFFFKKLQEQIVKIKNRNKNLVPSHDECYMTNAYSISKFSRCVHRKVGAVIIKENYVIASGYNEVPHGAESCKGSYSYCYRDKIKTLFNPAEFKPEHKPDDKKEKSETERAINKNLDLCRAIHAEERAILQSASIGGLSLNGSVLYTTLFPCQLCTKKIIETGISKIVYCEPYPTIESIRLLQDAHIEPKQFEGVKANGFFRLFRPQWRIRNGKMPKMQ